MQHYIDFLLEAKKHAKKGSLSHLALDDQCIGPSSTLPILLTSQYASALSDHTILIPSEFKEGKLKLPGPLLFAFLQKSLKAGKYQSAIKLLVEYSERKKGDNSHIIIFNISKLHRIQGDVTKQIFFLENLLKEEPFFSPAIYDLSLCFATSSRLSQALSLLQRHLNSLLSEDPLIHSALFFCLSQLSSFSYEMLKKIHSKTLTLNNVYNLALLLRKKGEKEKAIFLFSDIVSKLKIAKSTDDSSFKEKDEKLLILSQMNLIKLNRGCDFSQTAESLSQELIETQSSFLDPETVTYLKSLVSCPFSQKCPNISQPQNTEPSVLKEGNKGNSFDNLFSQTRFDNTEKLKNLLHKQKNIDRFFKNLKLKYKSSDQILSALTNSIKSAKQELSSEALSFPLPSAKQYVRLHNDKSSPGLDLQKILQTCLLNFDLQKKQEQHLKQYPSPRKSSKPMRYLGSPCSQNIKKETLLQKGRKQNVNKEKKNGFQQPKTVYHKRTYNLASDRSFTNFRIKPASKLVDLTIPKKIQNLSSTKRLSSQNIQNNQFKLQEGKRQIRIENKSFLEDERSLQQQGAKKVSEILSMTQEKLLKLQQKQNIPDLQQKDETKRDKEEKEEPNEIPQQFIEDPIEKKQENSVKQHQEPRKEYFEESEKNIEEKMCEIEKEESENRTVVEKESQADFEKQTQTIQKETSEKCETPLNQNSEKEIFQKSLLQKKQIEPSEDDKGVKSQTKQTIIENPQKIPDFDPLASTFNLTGYSHGQLLPHGSQPSLSPFSIFEAFAPQSSSAINQAFQTQIKQIERLQQQGQLDQAYRLLLQMYKQFKRENEKLIVLIKIGQVFQSQERFVQAEKTFTKTTKYDSSEAFFKLGSLQLRMGKVDEGVENLEKANCLKRFDSKIENKLVYGYSMKEETMEKALTLAHIILRKDPNSLETLLITAGILQRQGLTEEAIQIVKAMDESREAEYIKHYLGVLYMEASNLKEAFICFKAALVIKPDYVPSLIEVASIISESHPKDAIIVLSNVLKLSPGNRKALARLGKIYEAQGDFQNAMNTYKVALESQENYESYMKIGDCLAKKESYIEALLNYKEALNINKTHEAHAKVAHMFELKNEWGKSIQHFQAALSLIPNTPQQSPTRYSHFLSIGRLQVRLGQYEAAIQVLEETLENHQSLEALKLLGEASFGCKQYSTALDFFEKANKLGGGGNVQILESMAICLDRMEQYLASKALYQKILQKNPHNIRCLNNLGNILLITGQTNEAFYLFETMIELAPRNVEKRLKVADIYAQVGDWSKVEYHLLQCYRQRQHDARILEKLILLYKEKRDNKMAAKYEKKLSLLRASHKNKPN